MADEQTRSQIELALLERIKRTLDEQPMTVEQIHYLIDGMIEHIAALSDDEPLPREWLP